MSFLDRLHARIGDFWWYSAMVFMAARAADVLNVFVGLWLVPKYVSTDELGAVMPLTHFANFVALPFAVFAAAFRNEVNTLAVRGRFGQLKTLMRGVFVAAAVFLVLALVSTYFILPVFLVRIRVAAGSLGFLIVLASFLGSVAPVFVNALQALKKFKAYSTLNVLGAPVRLLTMLVAMPLRPISGYFAGQSATPAFQIVTAVIALRRELSVRAEAYWTRPVVRKFAWLFLALGAGSVATQMATLVEATVLRQRLPSLDSAAYYMVTRFSDISTFFSGTLIFTLFPFVAELAKRGQSTHGMVRRTNAAILLSHGLLAAVFALGGRPLLALLPHGADYASFWWAIPWLIGNNALGAIASTHVTTACAAERFGYLRWWIPLHAGYAALLLMVTGYGYFKPWLPGPLCDFLGAHNITGLPAMLAWYTAFAAVRLAFALRADRRQG